MTEVSASLKHIYLKTAAAGPLHPAAHKAGTEFLDELRDHGDIHFDKMMAIIDGCRARMAKYLSCEPAEVAFVSSSSIAMNIIALLLLRQGHQPRVLSNAYEFPSSTLPLIHHGFELDLPDAQDHRLHKDFWSKNLKPEHGMLLQSSIQYGTGYRTDIHAFTMFCQDNNLISCLNATQSIGAFPTDVSNIDFACGSIHKWMMAGFGLSFIKISKKYLGDLPLVGWLSQADPWVMLNSELDIVQEARALEAGCGPLLQMACLGAVLKWIEDEGGISAISDRVASKRQMAVDKIKQAGIEVAYDFGQEECSGTVYIPHAKADQIVEELAKKNIHVSARNQCLRVAFHWFVSESDVDQFVAVFKKIRSTF